jgi:hypothetical protein
VHLDSRRFYVKRGAGPYEARKIPVEVRGRLHLEVFGPLLVAVGHIPSASDLLWAGEMSRTCVPNRYKNQFETKITIKFTFKIQLEFENQIDIEIKRLKKIKIKKFNHRIPSDSPEAFNAL